jgi:AcrR family transcriptional regulator
METMERTSRTQAERSEATQNAIVSTARRLFAERGYAGVGTEEIVRAAGVTRGALYHHFDGKAGLFAAVFEQIESELATRFAEDALSEPDAFEAMAVALELFLDVCREPEVRQIALLDAPAVLGWTAWREVESRYSLGLIRAGLENMVQAGITRPQPIEPLAHAILGMLTEAGLYVANADDADAAKAEMGEVLRGTLDGLRSA